MEHGSTRVHHRFGTKVSVCCRNSKAASSWHLVRHCRHKMPGTMTAQGRWHRGRARVTPYLQAALRIPRVSLTPIIPCRTDTHFNFMIEFQQQYPTTMIEIICWPVNTTYINCHWRLHSLFNFQGRGGRVKITSPPGKQYITRPFSDSYPFDARCKWRDTEGKSRDTEASRANGGTERGKRPTHVVSKRLRCRPKMLTLATPELPVRAFSLSRGKPVAVFLPNYSQ